MENYIKGKGILVGTFNQEEISKNIDNQKVEEIKLKTGLKYTNTEFVKKGKEIVALRIYVCSLEDFKI